MALVALEREGGVYPALLEKKRLLIRSIISTASIFTLADLSFKGSLNGVFIKYFNLSTD
jgi:hypothetical protein